MKLLSSLQFVFDNLARVCYSPGMTVSQLDRAEELEILILAKYPILYNSNIV